MSKRLLLFLTLLLCLTSGHSLAQDASVNYRLSAETRFALPGFSLSRTETDAGNDFSDRMREMMFSLTAAIETTEEAEPFRDRLAGALEPYQAVDAEKPLDQLVRLSLSEAVRPDEAFLETIVRLLEASRTEPDEHRTEPDEHRAESDGLFLLSPFAAGSEEYIIGLSNQTHYASMLFFGLNEKQEMRVASQLVFTEWGVAIGQSSPETGVIRPDGSFVVLAPGETCFSLMDSTDLTELDRFTLTIQPGAETDSLTISASGEATGELTLRVGDVVQLTPVRSSDEPLSLVERLEPADATAHLPEALRQRMERGWLISVEENSKEEAGSPRILRILK